MQQPDSRLDRLLVLFLTGAVPYRKTPPKSESTAARDAEDFVAEKANARSWRFYLAILVLIMGLFAGMTVLAQHLQQERKPKAHEPSALNDQATSPPMAANSTKLPGIALPEEESELPEEGKDEDVKPLLLRSSSRRNETRGSTDDKGDNEDDEAAESSQDGSFGGASLPMSGDHGGVADQGNHAERSSIVDKGSYVEESLADEEDNVVEESVGYGESSIASDDDEGYSGRNYNGEETSEYDYSDSDGIYEGTIFEEELDRGTVSTVPPALPFSSPNPSEHTLWTPFDDHFPPFVTDNELNTSTDSWNGFEFDSDTRVEPLPMPDAPYPVASKSDVEGPPLKRQIRSRSDASFEVEFLPLDQPVPHGSLPSYWRHLAPHKLNTQLKPIKSTPPSKDWNFGHETMPENVDQEVLFINR